MLDLNDVGRLDLYVDGADESNHRLQLIKGGGGALTREKIVAAASRRFICIADESKLVDVLGRFPLPVEVIPMARSYVTEELVKLGGLPVLREGFVTDNGNVILDVHGLRITAPVDLEQRLNNIAGVVTVRPVRPAAGRPADPGHAGRAADGARGVSAGGARYPAAPGSSAASSLRAWSSTPSRVANISSAASCAARWAWICWASFRMASASA